MKDTPRRVQVEEYAMVPRPKPAVVTRSIARQPMPEPPPTLLKTSIDESNSKSDDNVSQNETLSPCEGNAMYPVDSGEEVTIPLQETCAIL